MKKTKLIVGIVGLLCVIGFSYGAELKIQHSGSELGLNCVEAFDIYMDLKDGEKTLASDIILDSNMEFVNFENAGIFKTYIPPRELGERIHLILLNYDGQNVVSGGKLGTVYYKVNLQELSYINFVFDGYGLGGDSNISIEGKDILRNVVGGLYDVSDGINCDEYTGYHYNEGDFQSIIDDITSDLKKQNKFALSWKCVLFVGLIIGIILLILLFVLRRRGQRK